MPRPGGNCRREEASGIRALVIPRGLGKGMGQSVPDTGAQEKTETALPSASAHGLRLLEFKFQLHNL
jgi:hypothetical protein